MAPAKPPIPAAAEPIYSDHFDPWNTSASGHQKAENRMGGSIGWRESRSLKLGHQFRSGNDGGQRISDKVGAGSRNWDDKAKALIPKDVRERAKRSVADMLMAQSIKPSMTKEEKSSESGKKEDEMNEQERKVPEAKKGIFDGLVIYINGSTHPLISDHKLKHLLAEHGARMSIHLGRRQVTHVILGRPNGQITDAGAGGGLTATKIQKEVKRVGGCAVKYVGVEWALESIKVGRRIPEARFENLKIAPKNQKSVYGMFQKTNST